MGPLKPIRTVIDTNVLISALLLGGTPGRLVPLWKTGRMLVFASHDIMEDYLRVLAYPKFRLTESEIEYLLFHEIMPFIKTSASAYSDIHIPEDPSDKKLIRCACASHAEYILSGDNHLLSIKSAGSIPIITPSRFLNIISRKS